MYSKILVTGGSGVLGQALKAVSGEYPSRSFIFCDSSDCDLRDAAATVNFVGSHHPDAIVHLAAVSGGVGLSINRPATLLRDNVAINMNVLEAARVHRTGKTVMTLSSGMYPEAAPNPLKEEYIHDGRPHASNYSYAFAKRLVEPSIRAYRAECGLNVIGLVPNGIFGKHADFAYESSAMWAALVRRFYESRPGYGENKDGQDPVVIWGDGSPLREHTYSEDLARAFMWCLDHYDEERVLNVGSTEEHSVKEIALMIADILGVDPARIEFDTTRPVGVARKSMDNSRFIEMSGFQFTPLRAGLEQTVSWFRENYCVPGKVRL